MFYFFFRTWQEGKIIIFDDSFEHEVWHEGESFRLVLIVDMWHPEITMQQRRQLSPIWGVVPSVFWFVKNG